MPSKSKAQHNLMAMVANDPKAAKRLGISKSVGEEYMKADKGKKYATGGSCGTKRMMGGGMAQAYKKGGSVTRADGCVKKGHTKGKMVSGVVGNMGGVGEEFMF
jgi:hypothetical protein